jgi:uncharacterized protein Smg (DUF494 family)
MENILENGIIPKFKSIDVKEGDMALFFLWKRYATTEKDKKAYDYLTESLKSCRFDILDLTNALAIAQKKNVYVDTRHVNHRGNKAVALKLYFDYVKNRLENKQ